MCELGRANACKGDTCRDPHVLSNMNAASRFVVVGQGPGWEELKVGMPFVGQSGSNFDAELIKNGANRLQFYITNTIKCFVQGNAKPTATQVKRCKPFLEMELTIIKPKLVVTLGASAFGVLCPNINYQYSLGKISISEEFDIKVFAVLHPSPLNLADKSRRMEFGRQIAILAKLVKRLQQSAISRD